MRMRGEWRGGGADAEPPVGPIVVGGEGGIGPATAWTVCFVAQVVDKYSFTCCLRD